MLYIHYQPTNMQLASESRTGGLIGEDGWRLRMAGNVLPGHNAQSEVENTIALDRELNVLLHVLMLLQHLRQRLKEESVAA